MTILSRWRSGLAKTSKATFGRIAGLLGATEITADTWDELEALLVQADLGLETTNEVISSLQRFAREEGLLRSNELEYALRAELRSRLDEPPALDWSELAQTHLHLLSGPGRADFSQRCSIGLCKANR